MVVFWSSSKGRGKREKKDPVPHKKRNKLGPQLIGHQSLA
jgi:hypothetical protein